MKTKKVTTSSKAMCKNFRIGFQPDVDIEKMSGPVPCRDFKQVDIGYLTFDLKITDLSKHHKTEEQTWGTTLSTIFQDFHYRKIMKRSDVLKILFICVCVCHVCPAHSCGDNPLRFYDNYSRNRGVETDALLVYIRSNHPSEYSRLVTDYAAYNECSQMVDNGYIKRSIPDDTRYDVMPTSQLSQGGDDNNLMDEETIQSFLSNGERQQQQHQQQNELWENIANSLSANDDNFSETKYLIKDRLPSRL